jgi:hypothetical protein
MAMKTTSAAQAVKAEIGAMVAKTSRRSGGERRTAIRMHICTNTSSPQNRANATGFISKLRAGANKKQSPPAPMRLNKTTLVGRMNPTLRQSILSIKSILSISGKVGAAVPSGPL